MSRDNQTSDILSDLLKTSEKLEKRARGRTLYDILGIPNGVPVSRVKDSYRFITNKTPIVEDAYQILSDPVQKRQYDAELAGQPAWIQGSKIAAEGGPPESLPEIVGFERNFAETDWGYGKGGETFTVFTLDTIPTTGYFIVNRILGEGKGFPFYLVGKDDQAFWREVGASVTQEKLRATLEKYRSKLHEEIGGGHDPWPAREGEWIKFADLPPQPKKALPAEQPKVLPTQPEVPPKEQNVLGPGVAPRKRAPKKPLQLSGSLRDELLFIAGTIGQKYAKAIEPEDAPQILGVPETATAAQAKAAWNKLLRSWHPDILQQKWEKNVIATGDADEEDNLHIHVAPKKGGDWNFQEFDLTVRADTSDRDKSLATIIGDHLTQVINAAYQAFEVLGTESGESTISPAAQSDETQPESQPNETQPESQPNETQPNAQTQPESSPKVETSPARLLPPAPRVVPTGNVVCSICSNDEFHTFSSSINIFGV